ncbi:MAG: PulJ/GspJ family protein [Opitutaceae bacterium]
MFNTKVADQANGTRTGFTLVEVMVATAVFATVIALSLSFFLSVSKINYTSEVKMSITSAARSLKNEFLINGRTAQSVILYDSFDATKLKEDSRKQEGGTGGFVVIVYSDTSTSNFKFTKLVGYHQASGQLNGEAITNIEKFELVVPEAHQQLTLEEILVNNASRIESSVLVENISPIVSDRVFTNIADSRSVHFGGEITRGKGDFVETKIIDITVTCRG